MKFLKNLFKKVAPVEPIGCVAKTILFDLSSYAITWESSLFGSLKVSIKNKKYELVFSFSGNVYISDAPEFKFNKTEESALWKMFNNILAAEKQNRENEKYLKSMEKMKKLFPDCL